MAYVVVGWLLIQIGETVFPPLELPAWTLRILIITVLAGFPIALVLAGRSMWCQVESRERSSTTTGGDRERTSV